MKEFREEGNRVNPAPVTMFVRRTGCETARVPISNGPLKKSSGIHQHTISYITVSVGVVMEMCVL